MFRVLLLAGLVLATSACTLIDQQATLRTSLDQHVEARGGPYAVEAVKAVELHLDVVEPQLVVEAHYLANRSRCMRIDLYDNGRYLQSEGVSSSGGWQRRAGDATDSPEPPEGTRILLHGIENPVRLIGLDEFPQRGHHVADKGSEKLGSVKYERINVVYADGTTTDFYLDPTTHLIARARERRPLHAGSDAAPLPIETQYSDYRAVAGVQFPFYSRELNWETGEELGHTTVRTLSVNSPAAVAVCDKPSTPLN